jgi:hypothetical protein
MPTIDEVVTNSSGGLWLYDSIEYHGVRLLITKGVLSNIIENTWERTHNIELQALATELGIELRKLGAERRRIKS